jgi:MFS family permease
VRKPLYYGWVNLGLAALAMVATLPGRTQGLGLVTEPLLRDLGLDRVTYAQLNLWATLIGALFCLPCGRWVDRAGARTVLVVVLVALGGAVLWMSTAGGLAALAVSVTLTRGFGQSALSVVSLALVGKWFTRRLNLAMGVYSLLVGLGFVIGFVAVGQAVLAAGWRAAWSGVALFQIVVLAPLSLWLVRSTPGERGLAVDVASAEDDPGLEDLSLAAALRSPAFWVFAVSSALFGLVYSGIALFNQSILEERGFDATVYHWALGITTLFGLAANFGGGWLAMRWPIQRLMGLGMGALALALAGLPLVSRLGHVMAWGVAMGIAGGIVTVVFFSVWGRAFGRAHLGRIQGTAQMLTVVASAVGPLVLATTLARTGSYSSIFNVLAGVVVALGLCCWYVPLPRRAPQAARALAGQAPTAAPRRT